MKKIAIMIGDISRSAGTERAVANLSNMLVKYGEYSVTILSCFSSDNCIPYYELEKNVKIIHLNLNNSSSLKKVFTYFNLVNIVNKITKQESFDFLIGTTHALNCMMIAMSKSIKKIACEHMSYNACPKVSKIFRKFCYPKLDAVVLLTKADASHYNFIEQSKLYVIPNSLSFIVDSPAKLLNKRIIAVGRLTEQKGFDILIDIAQNIKNELSDWHIDIFGDGEDKEELLCLIKEKDVENFVTIRDPVKNIKAELLASSIYVMTSRWEGLPMILLEAKACGLPIISFDCPEGPADVIHDGDDGYLLKMFDTKGYCQCIKTLVNDYNLRCIMGEKSYNNAVEFSEEKVFMKWMALLER